MDRSTTLLFLAAAAMVPSALLAQRSGCTDQQARVLYEQLRDEPATGAHIGAARYILVDQRFERVTTRKQARRNATYVKRVAPARHGWSVQVFTADNQLLMEGTSLDREGQVLDGEFTFRDEAGHLRAQGRFDHGRKTGVWQRYSATGETLPDKTYYGEDWDAMQVRVGLATMSNDLGTEAASQSGTLQ